MPIGDGGSLSWRRFADFSAVQLYEMLQFRQAIFVVEQASPYPDLDGLDQPAEHLLLQRAGALCGYARLIPFAEERRFAIGRVSVAPGQRRRGLAGTLMREALARCRRDHPDWAVGLSAQAHLAGFYETLGFGAVSAAIIEYGIPHIEMTLRR